MSRDPLQRLPELSHNRRYGAARPRRRTSHRMSAACAPAAPTCVGGNYSMPLWRPTVVKWSSTKVALVLGAAVGMAAASCSAGKDAERPPVRATTDVSADSTTAGTASCPTRDTAAPRVVSTERLDHTEGDGVNARFETPPAGDPGLTASAALKKLDANALSGPVDAVLAVWTNLVPEPDDAGRVVWVLRNRNIPVAPSMGPPVCGEAAWVVDGANGTVYFGSSGAALL